MALWKPKRLSLSSAFAGALFSPHIPFSHTLSRSMPNAPAKNIIYGSIWNVFGMVIDDCDILVSMLCYEMQIHLTTIIIHCRRKCGVASPAATIFEYWLCIRSRSFMCWQCAHSAWVFEKRFFLPPKRAMNTDSENRETTKKLYIHALQIWMRYYA